MSTETSALKKGWLKKWVNILKGYQKRWFVLSLTHLSYYRVKDDQETLHGGMRLADLLIYHGQGTNFVISDGGTQVFHLKSSSIFEKDQWIAAITLAKNHAVRAAKSDEFCDILNHELGGLNRLSGILDSNFNDLCACHKQLKTSVESLHLTLSELEANENRNNLSSKLCSIVKKASVVKGALRKTLSDCEELLQTAEDHKFNLQNMKQLILRRLNHLDKVVDQLAAENSILTSALKGMDLGVLSDSCDGDEQFYDSLEISPSELFLSYRRSTFRTPPCTEDSLYTTCSICSTGTICEDSETHGMTPNILQRESSFSVLESDLNYKNLKTVLRRTSLPEQPQRNFSIWAVIKNCIGKDLTRIAMPVYFNEPLSTLQRLTEEYEYASLLHKAALCKDSCEQLSYVAAFVVSAYSSSKDRNGKPFNPLLGETYECDRFDDFGWRCFSEQVSHHPPIQAQHCEGNGWTLWQEFSVEIAVRGTYVSVTPSGICHLEFSESGNHYTWSKVCTSVHNLVIGTMWIDHHGEMDISNHTTGDKCIVQFSQYKYFQNESFGKVSGVVTDKQSNAQWVLQGKWNEEIEALKVSHISDETAPKVIWRKTASSEKKNVYNMSVFACQLNEPEEGVAPTDSRFRPDQRLMEEGKWEEANSIKFELEEKQRQRRRQREQEAEDSVERGEVYPMYKPAWFTQKLDPITSNPVHVFTGEYWDCKAVQDWSRCPDIYL